MIQQLQEVFFETRTIGPMVLTTPVLQRLRFREIVNCYCPIAEQADLDHGLVAELVAQSRLSDLAPCMTLWTGQEDRVHHMEVAHTHKDA